MHPPPPAASRRIAQTGPDARSAPVSTVCSVPLRFSRFSVSTAALPLPYSVPPLSSASAVSVTPPFSSLNSVSYAKPVSLTSTPSAYSTASVTPLISRSVAMVSAGAAVNVPPCVIAKAETGLLSRTVAVAGLFSTIAASSHPCSVLVPSSVAFTCTAFVAAVTRTSLPGTMGFQVAPPSPEYVYAIPLPVLCVVASRSARMFLGAVSAPLSTVPVSVSGAPEPITNAPSPWLYDSFPSVPSEITVTVWLDPSGYRIAWKSKARPLAVCVSTPSIYTCPPVSPPVYAPALWAAVTTAPFAGAVTVISPATSAMRLSTFTTTPAAAAVCPAASVTDRPNVISSPSANTPVFSTPSSPPSTLALPPATVTVPDRAPAAVSLQLPMARASLAVPFTLTMPLTTSPVPGCNMAASGAVVSR